jgi:hypothetical protein
VVMQPLSRQGVLFPSFPRHFLTYRDETIYPGRRPIGAPLRPFALISSSGGVSDGTARAQRLAAGNVMTACSHIRSSTERRRRTGGSQPGPWSALMALLSTKAAVKAGAEPHSVVARPSRRRWRRACPRAGIATGCSGVSLT